MCFKEDIASYRFMSLYTYTCTLVESIVTRVSNMYRNHWVNITNIWQEASCGSGMFSSPAKWYKVSRWRVLVDTFDREAVRRKIYQLYKMKEHVTVKKLLVTRLCVTVVKLWKLYNSQHRPLYERIHCLLEGEHYCSTCWRKWGSGYAVNWHFCSSFKLPYVHSSVWSLAFTSTSFYLSCTLFLLFLLVMFDFLFQLCW